MLSSRYQLYFVFVFFQAANINSEREAEEQSIAIQESRLKKKGNIDLRSKS